MPDNEIGAKVVLTGEDRGASAAVGKLRDETGKFVGASHEAGSAADNLGAKVQEAAQHAESASGAGIGKLKGSLVELAGQVPGVTGALNFAGEAAEALEAGPLGALALGVGVVAAGFEAAKEAVEEFSRLEVADTKLDQALANAGQLTDEYRGKLQGLAKELQETTNVAEERWLATLARLEQFGANSSNIEEYATAVKNLAGILGGDVERAGIIFSRVMNGNTTVLGRLGIQVDKTADQHTKLEQIMAQLAARGGGQLEAQTHTITGEFTALEHATADVFKGIGNLISQTGLLQGGLEVLTGALRLFGGLFPQTVGQVEGLTNKLPPLRDAAGHVKGAVDEMGGSMEEAGDSADAAADGLDRAGESAGKAKDKFEEATEAAKKLRQQQDQLADAQTALKIANVEAAQESGRISRADANQQRAQIRADAETSKIGREVQEQQTVLQQQRDKEGVAGAGVAVAHDQRTGAEDEFADKAQQAGISSEDASRIGAEGDASNINQFGVRAQALRNEQAKANRNLQSLEDAQGQGADESAAIQKEAQRSAVLEKQATALEALAKAYTELRQARDNDADAEKHLADVQRETTPKMDEARARLQTLGVQGQAAVVKAATEQQRLADEAEKKRIEEDQKRLEHSLKTEALPDATVRADQDEFRRNQLRLNQLQYKGDAAGLAVANATLPVPPGAEQNVKIRQELIKQIDDTLKDVPNLTPDQKDRLVRRRDALAGSVATENERGDSPILRDITEQNRQREQGTRDDKDTGGAAGIMADARAVNDALVKQGPPNLGTVSGNAQAALQSLIPKLLASGGTNQVLDHQFLTILEQYVDAQRQIGQDTRALQDRVKDLGDKLQQLTTETRNRR